MKIFIILPYLKSIGGAGRYAWELSEYLVERGDDVTIVSLYTDRNLYRSEKIRIMDLADSQITTQSLRFWTGMRKWRAMLHDLVARERPDMVLFNHFPSTLWAQRYPGIPTLCYPHDIDLLYSDTYTGNLPWPSRTAWGILRILVRHFDKRQWGSFDQILCNSNFSAQKISDKYAIPLPDVIYPGTDTEVFSPTEAKSEEKSILLLGDHKARRVEFLLENVGDLAERRQDLRIWIVGSHGKYAEEMRRLVAKQGIEGIVTFFGRVPDSELRGLYGRAHIFVHLQRLQPFGLAFIEAMSCGTPIIGCVPGATSEIIVEGETGFSIPEDDPKALLESIERIFDNPELYKTMSLCSRSRVRQHFEINSQYQKLRDRMLELIHKDRLSRG